MKFDGAAAFRRAAELAGHPDVVQFMAHVDAWAGRMDCALADWEEGKVRRLAADSPVIGEIARAAWREETPEEKTTREAWEADRRARWRAEEAEKAAREKAEEAAREKEVRIAKAMREIEALADEAGLIASWSRADLSGVKVSSLTWDGYIIARLGAVSANIYVGTGDWEGISHDLGDTYSSSLVLRPDIEAALAESTEAAMVIVQDCLAAKAVQDCLAAESAERRELIDGRASREEFRAWRRSVEAAEAERVAEATRRAKSPVTAPAPAPALNNLGGAFAALGL